ncbi:TetR family transcriptional regulator [Streptomyces aurantiacus]|uniref:Putative HTH-type transcriptional repressor NicS n=1 Tax=Streptomyces aurantiacus JA 4570 TaxID=1286094 RepID=S3ZS39_9ACTN|nr:TetR family transcriptional regulator [Streptomyces aurantiacus]EPH45998.1 putative HTH-type transcriptional repressor NicS [Streptomyces aurantiacus JA 4570]
MAVRDPEATRARIFDAAVAEFARFGIAGARIDRIAGEAKANKQLIYAYYGNKAELFAQVLEKKMLDLAVSVPVDADDMDGWMDRLIEYHATHPEVLRLLFWEGIEYGGTEELPHEYERQAHYDSKVAAFEEAQARGVITDAIPATDLLFMLVALAGWASAVPQMRRILVGAGDEDRARLRASVRAAARRLTAPTD